MQYLLIMLALSEGLTWQWPVDMSHGISGSFGEYRGSRFHMGLDISTGGKEGQPVFAAAAGRVVQVRSDEDGYGRAIYIEHPGGYVSVYAHLAAFAAPIKAALTKLKLDPEGVFGRQALDIAVSAGQQIAFSGESGAGMPHLHFEVREPGSVPVDPLSLNFPKLDLGRDQIVLKALHLLPMDPASRVNGSAGPVRVSARHQRIQASGQVGILVEGYIGANRGSRLAFRGVRLRLDGKLIAEWQPRRMPFDHYRRGSLIYDRFYTGFGPTTYAYAFDGRHQLFEALPSLQSDGLLQVESSHQLSIEVQNIAGQWLAFGFRLEPDAPVLQSLPALRKQPLWLPKSGWPFWRNRLLDPVTELGLSPSDQKMLTVIKTDDVSHVLAPSTPLTVTWEGIEAKVGSLAGDSRHVVLGDWQLEIPSHPYGEMALALVPHGDMPEWMRPVSPILLFGHNGLPLTQWRARFTGSDTSSEGEGRMGLYQWKNGRWLHEDTPSQTDAAAFDYSAPHVWARDVQPPVLRKPAIHRYFNGTRTVIPVVEKGSGIDRHSLLFTAAGRTYAVTYDGDRRWVVLPQKLPPKPWRLEIADRSGLKATATYR